MNTSLIEELKKKAEIDPYKHDGSYTLMREIVEAYSTLPDYSHCTFRDLNAIYAMAIGTWKLNIEKKKEYVNKGCLPEEQKAHMNGILDAVWNLACLGEYEHHEDSNKPTVGMFGTGFYSFERKTGDAEAQAFIAMLVDLQNMTDEEQLFERAESVLKKPIKGMQAASLSVILHCLKPMTFPIINGYVGNGDVYEALGVKLVKPKDGTAYISNCRRIKAVRDQYFSFKNYRILDLVNPKRNMWDIEAVEGSNMTKANYDCNTILYGPPGTGKTYNTVLYAVGIIEGKSIDELKDEEYEAVKARFDEYKAKKQIAFTTFHQSYGYEEFIEGIKPAMAGDDGASLGYTIEPGVFKKICDQASVSKIAEAVDYGLNNAPAVWKVSLGHTYDNPIRTECMENNHIRIAWDEYGEELPDTEDNYSGKVVLNSFYNKMRIGDIVFSCYSASSIDAIGVITGECEWHDEYSEYKRVRSVKWLVKGIEEDIVELNNGSNMTLSTVYKLKIDPKTAIGIVEKYTDASENHNSSNKNYVFIIDEINRGNISKIFGELITLIEKTKRSGADEEMDVILPYSGSRFSVPDNVYILGTMNTADRSIALMDTALRRRFSFIEMMPNADVLRSIGAAKVESNGETLDVANMLEVINKRIECLYDREHTIGHAFFTPLKNDPSIERLASIFEKSVIPLLQEYFYEDYSKIQLILGDNAKTGDDKKYQFVMDNSVNATDIFAGYPDDVNVETKFEINKAAFTDIHSYKLIGKDL